MKEGEFVADKFSFEFFEWNRCIGTNDGFVWEEKK